MKRGAAYRFSFPPVSILRISFDVRGALGTLNNRDLTIARLADSSGNVAAVAGSQRCAERRDLENPIRAGFSNTPQSPASLQRTPASGDQVEDQDDQRDHQQKVNQTSGDVETETQKPQDQNDDENCPKHIFSVASGAAVSTQLEVG